MYLGSMKRGFHKRLKSERKRWGTVLIICALSSFYFSSQLTLKSITYHLTHPIEFFKMEQENPFSKILTIFRADSLPDKLKRFRL